MYSYQHTHIHQYGIKQHIASFIKHGVKYSQNMASFIKHGVKYSQNMASFIKHGVKYSQKHGIIYQTWRHLSNMA